MAEEPEQAELDGWPTFSLETADVRQVSSEAFRELLAACSGDGRIHAVETAPGGTVKARVLDHQRHDQTDGCRYFLELYLEDISVSWEPERLTLLDEPCYVVTGSGVVVLADGRIVSETLFPTGNPSLASRVGGGLAIDNIGDEIKRAATVEEGSWAPLLSRGSVVYGHAIAESMVQDSAFHRAGLSPLISYAASARRGGAQHIVAARARSSVVSFRAALVKVPRVVFASKLYRHLPLGTEYARCIETIRADLPVEAGATPQSDKIYVSRLGVEGRRMTNEAELIAVLSDMGFRIVAGEELSFEDQAAIFHDARLIVGPYGSGLANAAFAAPHAALCELRSLNNPHNSPNWDNYYMGLAAMRGFFYGISVTENPPGTDSWECSIPDVIALVEAAAAALDQGR